MKVTKIDFLYQISFYPTLFPINCYLVEEEDGLTLIDAALPNCAANILKIAEQTGKKITNIALTHAHGDHVGALDAIKKFLPDVIVSISARDAKLLKGDRSLNAGENNPIRGGVPKDIKTIPNRLLCDGDQIGSLTAIAVPGHTPGSMAFIDKRTNAVIAGDAFQTQGGFAISGQLKWRFPFPACATWDKEQAIQSAKKIIQLNPKLLAVGHGKMLSAPKKHIETALK